MSEEMRELSLDELALASGGVDYSREYPYFSTITARFRQLIDNGMKPDEARQQTINEYWAQVLEICRRNPDECPPQEQAVVIFAMLIGT